MRTPPRRITNLALLAALLVAFATCAGAVAAGSPGGRWVVIAHGVVGVAVVLLTPWKAGIVRRGLRRGPPRPVGLVAPRGARLDRRPHRPGARHRPAAVGRRGAGDVGPRRGRARAGAPRGLARGRAARPSPQDRPLAADAAAGGRARRGCGR